MKQLPEGALSYSATDLSNFISCRHKTLLDLQCAQGEIPKPSGGDPYAEIAQELGLRHEAAYVNYLKKQGKQIADLRPDDSGMDKVQRTERAMADGADVIIQGALRHGQWMGYADILYKVSTPGRWEWSYEIGDTKLAQTTKAGTILQLCVYSDLLTQVQGVEPAQFHVIKPGKFEAPETFRYADYAAYYRYMRNAFVSQVEGEMNMTYPHPVPHCDVCRWWKQCADRRKQDDHLCQVAGMQSSHIRQLNEIDVHTMEGFASRATAFDGRPTKGTIHTFERLHRQAGIQQNGRVSGHMQYEFLERTADFDPSERRGLERLPEPDAGDVFFDIESDRFHEDGSLEYLLGIVFQEKGEWIYKPFWGLNRKDEKSAFEALMDFLMARLDEYPGYYIYHFAPYEPSALKHLMLRHSTRVEDVDRLLRGERLIDLHAIVRQALIASVESYGLKPLEPFIEHQFKRQTSLRDASLALLKMQRSLELHDPEGITEDVIETVRSYNEEDCRSTLGLRDWLEQLRGEYTATHRPIARPPVKDGKESDKQEDKRTRITELFDQLLAQLPEDVEQYNSEHRAMHLLAYLLEYFNREEKNFWWEYFTRKELEYDALLEDRKAIVGLTLVEAHPAVGRKSPIHVYSYPFQELSMSGGEVLCDLNSPDGEKDDLGEVTEFDLKRRLISIKKRGAAIDRHPTTVQLKRQFPTKNLEESLLDFAENVCKHGLDNDLIHASSRDLLMRNPPRIEGQRGSLRKGEESTVSSAVRSATMLNQSVLPLQGPPGTGKTFTGAQMILALLQSHKRIGITAVGHKVIDNLLKRVHDEAVKKGITIELFHVGSPPDDAHPGINYIDKAHGPDQSAAGHVVGATVFHWSSPPCIGTLDYLFIDEAGQMSLALILAASRCAKNLILLGDPQQLDQPQQASHPEGSDVSALSHYLGGHQTIDPERGIFLDTTWRLHPEICRFTSELYYDGKLHALDTLGEQVLNGDHPFARNQETGNRGAGMYYVPVEHSGNSNQSDEEIAAINTIVNQLLALGNTWTFANDKGSEARPMTKADIMVIAPFNAQVAALREALPEISVGTVDKFQGGEAAVVIYSMASSSVEDAPRGMSFIFAPNRLNVASSRARCAFILVASPKLFEVECNTPAQMEWANGMCRFREVAREVIV